MGLRSRLDEFCRNHGLDALYVFGSRAEEVRRRLDAGRLVPAASSSDVDIGILPPESVVLPEADSFLAVNVIRGERLYFRDAHRIDEYELFVLRRAGDLAPFERERLAMIGGA